MKKTPSSHSFHADTPNATGNVLSHDFYPLRISSGNENMGLFVEKILRTPGQQKHGSQPGPAPSDGYCTSCRSHTPEAGSD